MKEQNKILKYINKGLNIQSGYDRMIFFVFIFILLCHIATCLWIMTATIMSEEEIHDGKKYKGTWLSPWEKSYSSDSAFYCISFYWTITTITTVGYGDISATNLSEMIFASIMMVIGVISFSFANGALTSILATSDSENGNFNSKVEILEKAKKKYHIPDTLYRRTKKSIKYAIQNDQEDLYNFVQELPHHIQNEMSQIIFKQKYVQLKYFHDRSKSFITWAIQKFKPQYFDQDSYIYKEGDEITDIYFLNEGYAHQVIPLYDNQRYVEVSKGDHFGIIDIIGCQIFLENQELDNWFEN